MILHPKVRSATYINITLLIPATDFDPEEHGEVYQNVDDVESGEDEDGDEVDGSREHYVDVGYCLNDRATQTSLLIQYFVGRASFAKTTTPHWALSMRARE